MWADVTGMAFGIGAALLALWLDARAPRLFPATFVRVVGHALVALVVLHAAQTALRTVAGGGPLSVLAVLFALTLPALVYVFLAAIWVIRTLQGALAGSPRL